MIGTPIMRKAALAAALFIALVGARQRTVRPPAAPAPQPVIGPTFSKEIVRIFQESCQSCHRPDDIAPFSLLTYEDAKPHAQMIKLMTRTRQMPPWKPAPGCGDFAEERVLSQSAIDLITKWVDNGAPEGNRADLPAPLPFNGEWIGGTPDLVLGSAEPYTPPASGDMYRCFTIPTNLTADQYISTIDFKPGDRETVHHVIAFIDTSGESAALDANDAAPGYQCFGGPGFTITSLDSSTLGGWAPGSRPVSLPAGTAFLLPKASRVVLQVHYHPHHGAPGPDQTQIGVYYSKTPPTKLMRILPLINDTFTIPPNNSNYKVTAEFTVPKIPGFSTDSHAWLIAPHMHLLGRKMKVTATRPNGQTECMIDITDWDFNWQGMYRYKNAVAIPGGTKLSLEAFYDNSSENFRNPNNPPRPVSWGEETTDEMCIAFIGVTLDAENLASGQRANASWMRRVNQ